MLRRTRDGLRRSCTKKWKKCNLRDTIHRVLPITQWLPEYKLRKDLPGDIAAGLSVGIINIPQGLAFAMLASLPLVTGLYVALVPVLAYVLLGTSKHLSVGTFPVVCIMVGAVIDGKMKGHHAVLPHNITNGSILNESTSSGEWSPDPDKEKIVISATLCLVVGIIQTTMGFLRLGFITIFLSDPLISGFTTGAACWVFTTQIQHILAIYPERYTGPFSLIKTYIGIFKKISDINFVSLIIGILCMSILLLLKNINERYKRKLKFPIPAELIVVALSTGISYGANLKQNYHIKIVDSVPRGLPPLSVPSNDLISDLLVDGFVISIVAFAINISLAKLFSQQHGYLIDANQELVAYGVQNIVGGFFSCFVSAANLGRSLIQANLGKTQIASVISCAIILLVLTVLAPLFNSLPKAVLGAIVIVAIRGLFKNFARVRKLWKVNKIDAMTWVVTWTAVILFGMGVGLGIGVLFSIFSLAYFLPKPNLSILGEVRDKVGVYEDINGYEDVTELPGVVIVRFHSSLCFINAERFKEKLLKKVFCKNRSGKAKKKHYYSKQEDEEKNLLDNNDDNSSEDSDSTPSLAYSESQHMSTMDYVHSVIVDCSSFSFVDSAVVSTMYQIVNEYERQDVKLYLVKYSYEFLKVMKMGNILDGNEQIFLMPTISEAVQHAFEERPEQIISKF